LKCELDDAKSKIHSLAAALREAEVKKESARSEYPSSIILKKRQNDRLEFARQQDSSSLQMKHTLSQITAGFESDRSALQNQLEILKQENLILRNSSQRVRFISECEMRGNNEILSTFLYRKLMPAKISLASNCLNSSKKKKAGLL
jgi:hypothetical protein